MKEKGKRHIVRVFQFWLFVCILVAFVITGIFTATVQSRISESENIKITQTTITDVCHDLEEAYDNETFSGDMDKFVGNMTKNRHIGKAGYVVICDSDLNILTEGLIYSGKNLSELGLDMEIGNLEENKISKVELPRGPHMFTYQFVKGYYIIGLIPTDEAMYLTRVSIGINLFVELIIFVALFILIYFLVKWIVLDNLIKVNSQLEDIAAGNLDVTIDVRSNAEFASLSDDINATVDTLKGYIADEAARIDTELEFAKQIQYASLPSTFPQNESVEIYADMHTAKEVGGDFYDYYMLEDSKLAFLVADVSGKGIPAAMFMMRAKTTIKDLAEQGLEPDAIFAAANEKLCEDNDTFMFVTAWMGILDLKTGVLKFVNAGHNPPLLCKYGNEFEFVRIRSGIALAVMEGVTYQRNELQMEPGDRLYLYTDGVTEAMNNAKNLYGEKRLQGLLNGLGEVSPEIMCHSVKESVDNFAGGVSQFDDITMLSVAFEAAIDENRIKVVPREGSGDVIQHFAEKLVGKLELVPKVAGRIHIIFDEIYSNIVHYSKANIAEISYVIKNEKLYLSFVDDGIPYNPMSAEKPDLTLDAAERELGGLGIHLARRLAEQMDYRCENGKNMLEIVISLRG